MRFGDFGAIEAVGFEIFERAGVIQADFAVDLGRGKLSAVLPKQRRLGILALGELGQFAGQPPKTHHSVKPLRP